MQNEQILEIQLDWSLGVHSPGVPVIETFDNIVERSPLKMTSPEQFGLVAILEAQKLQRDELKSLKLANNFRSAGVFIEIDDGQAFMVTNTWQLLHRWVSCVDESEISKVGADKRKTWRHMIL